MQITPADLSEGGDSFSGTLEVEIVEVEGSPEVSAPRPVEYEIRAVREGPDLRISGSVGAVLEVSCVRCLEGFPLEVRREIDVLYRPAPESGGNDERELDAADLDLDYYRGDSLDLGRLLAEQLLLSLPMKPMCDSGCRGLCSVCGADLNVESCDCEPAVDPRLASLGAIRDQL